MAMDKNKDRIAEEAAEYLARRVSGSKPTSGDGFPAWLKADADHAQAYDKAGGLWEELGALRSDQDLVHLKRSDIRKHVGRFPWARRMRTAAAAAVMLLAVGGAYTYIHRVKPVIGSFASEAEERKQLTLDDGTAVVLNIDSEIATSFTRGQRDVVLVRGEADFQVAHDNERPFVVRVGEGSVTALGTQFQVRRDEKQTLITLLQGSVSVRTPRGFQTLMPNESATLLETGAITMATVDPATALGWMEGRLSFRNATLSEVVSQANRYSRRKIIIVGAGLANIRLSGDFEAGESESIASAVERILPVSVIRENDRFLIEPK